MNNSTVAKNGFKSFILTLAVSLLVFSVIYYVQTSSSNKVNIESTDKTTQANADSPAVPATENKSAFKDIKASDQAVAERVVLGGATETSESTVPGTGVTGITYAFAVSVGMVLLGAYLFIYEPRRRALLDFEKRVKRGLK
jgi:hypothetical protein